MILLPGPVARYLTQSLVGIVPAFTDIEPYRDKNLNVWRRSGSHFLTASNTKGFDLGANQREYAGHMISEVEHLLNHAAEHRTHLVNSLSTKDEPSPAWMFVSLYYFSLFVAMAWTRCINRGIVYLNRDAIKEYCGISATQVPGAGAFCASARLDSETDKFEVDFRKCSRSHFHEAVWIEAAEAAKKASSWLLTLSTARSPTADEMIDLRSMKLFADSKFDDPLVWPSTLRNALNYRPGFGYRSVPKQNRLKTSARLARRRWANMEGLVSFGESAKSALASVREPSDSPNEAIDLLIAQALSLEAHVEAALRHLYSIQGLQCSASAARKRFARPFLDKTDSVFTEFVR